jgi:hypothetical protein
MNKRYKSEGTGLHITGLHLEGPPTAAQSPLSGIP